MALQRFKTSDAAKPVTKIRTTAEGMGQFQANDLEMTEVGLMILDDGE